MSARMIVGVTLLDPLVSVCGKFAVGYTGTPNRLWRSAEVASGCTEIHQWSRSTS